jgi:hypothetical protein
MPGEHPMPVLSHASALAEHTSHAAQAFPVCANPRCASGWLHLWRKRRVPVVEGGWLCSPACTRSRIEDLLRREHAEAHPPSVHRHRVPIGLVLLNQGWATHEQIKDALGAQRNGSRLRLGEWLVVNRGLDEAHLTQALGLQWSCPVFSLQKQSGGLPVTLVPRILSETFGFIPLRLSSSGVLYLAFEDRIDHSLTLAVERVTGFAVESGLLCAPEFRKAWQIAQQHRLAPMRLIEAGSFALLAEAFTRQVEKRKPTNARLVRLHDLFWLRLWRPATDASRASECEDIVGSVARFV